MSNGYLHYKRSKRFSYKPRTDTSNKALFKKRANKNKVYILNSNKLFRVAHVLAEEMFYGDIIRWPSLIFYCNGGYFFNSLFEMFYFL